jgi:hypothetical protein
VSRASPDLWEPWASNRPGPPDRERERERERGREVRQAKPVEGGPDEVTDESEKPFCGA